MINFYKKYINWIVLGLFFVVCIKSCKSCVLETQSEWNTNQYEIKLDSIYNTHNKLYNTLTDSINGLTDSITYYKLLFEKSEMERNRMYNDNNYLKKINESLIKTVTE